MHPHIRIGLASVSLLPGHGGIARVARLMARCLQESQLEHEILILNDPDLSAAPIGINCASAHGNKSKFVWLLHGMARRCSHIIYDYAGLGRGHPFLPGLRRPYMVWMHGREAWENLRPGVRRVFTAANRILVNSNHTLRRFESLHQSLPLAHLCPLATEDEPDIVVRPASELPTVLLLGRMCSGGAGKGHAEMIDCWPDVIARLPNARLLIAGDGDAVDAYRERARKLVMDESIVFTGFVPDDKIQDLWRSTDILAMPSRQEGFGLVYAEAMARAIPVIASTLDAGCETNIHGVTGLNVDPDQPGSLTEAILTLLQNQRTRHQMGTAGRVLWQEKYQYHAFADRFLGAVRSFAEIADTANKDAGRNAA